MSTVSDSTSLGLAELARKTGLVLRTVDSTSVDSLFATLEAYNSQERAETFDYLKRALNHTRTSLGSEPVYLDE